MSSEIFKVPYYEQICCEECYSVVHNHFNECPICKTEDAATDVYSEMWNRLKENVSCEECNSEFKVHSNYKFILELELISQPNN